MANEMLETAKQERNLAKLRSAVDTAKEAEGIENALFKVRCTRLNALSTCDPQPIPPPPPPPPSPPTAATTAATAASQADTPSLGEEATPSSVPYANNSWTFRGKESFKDLKDFKESLKNWGVKISEDEDMRKQEEEQIKNFYEKIDQGKEGLRVWESGRGRRKRERGRERERAATSVGSSEKKDGYAYHHEGIAEEAAKVIRVTKVCRVWIYRAESGQTDPRVLIKSHEMTIATGKIKNMGDLVSKRMPVSMLTFSNWRKITNEDYTNKEIEKVVDEAIKKELGTQYPLSRIDLESKHVSKELRMSQVRRRSRARRVARSPGLECQLSRHV